MITIKDGELYQWDTGRVISVIPRSGETVNEIHVYNGTTECALVLQTWEENSRTCAKIPDTFLQITNNINVYAVMTDAADRRTTEHAQYMVYSRKKPEDYIYEPEEILRYETLENLIKEKITTPATASIGQVLVVKAVDENGKPTEWETAETVSQETLKQTVSDTMQEMVESGELGGLDGDDGKDGIGISSVTIDANGHLIINYTDNTNVDAGKVMGEDGLDGASGIPARKEMTAEDTAVELQPNILYIFPEMAELTLTLAEPTDTTITSEYHCIFTSGATATTLTLPDTVKILDGFTVEASKVYELSIMENCLAQQSWAVE